MTKKVMQNQKNADVMNTVIAEGGIKGLPFVTAENYQSVGERIAGDYEGVGNSFITTLINKVGLTIFKSAQSVNPLGVFKKGDMPLGYTIEEVFVEIAKRNAFSPETAHTTELAQAKPDVKTMYHSINRQDFYKGTVSQVQLAHAFKSPSGLAQLVAEIVNSLTEGDNHDEFQLTKKCIIDGDTARPIKRVTIADPTTSESAMKAFVKQARLLSNKFTFMSRDYNSAGVLTNARKSNQVILITPEIEASMDVDVLASAFNMSRTEFLAMRVVVDAFAYDIENKTGPNTSGSLDGVVAMLCDRDAFIIHDTHFSATSKFVNEGLYWNYWLHHHQILSLSSFANAVLFTTASE